MYVRCIHHRQQLHNTALHRIRRINSCNCIADRDSQHTNFVYIFLFYLFIYDITTSRVFTLLIYFRSSQIWIIYFIAQKFFSISILFLYEWWFFLCIYYVSAFIVIRVLSFSRSNRIFPQHNRAKLRRGTGGSILFIWTQQRFGRKITMQHFFEGLNLLLGFCAVKQDAPEILGSGYTANSVHRIYK